MNRESIIGDETLNINAINLYNKIDNLLDKEWNSITLCSAYLTEPAAESLISFLANIKQKTRLDINVLIGVKNYFTSPNAIERVLGFIENLQNNHIKYSFVIPYDMDFHIKCYIFSSLETTRAIIGSANLTTTGLSSKGELMVEIAEKSLVDKVINHINYYLMDSISWGLYIKQYKKIYKENKPPVLKQVSPVKKMHVRKARKFNEISASPTIEILSRTNISEQEIEKILASLRRISLIQTLQRVIGLYFH